MNIYEPNSSLLTIKYYPENVSLIENPPRFTWMPAGDDTLNYTLEISKDKDFKSEVIVRNNIPYNFYTLDETLLSGEFFWRYKTDLENSNYSKVRSFIVSDNLPNTPIFSRENRYDSVKKSHPRLWLNDDQVSEFKKNLKLDNNYCDFDTFYKNSVVPFLDMKFFEEPKPYPNNKRVIKIWRGNYMICQEAMYYIRSLSIAGIILEDMSIIEKAKNALLEIVKWDTDGPTSRNYNDECSFRVAYAIAFGYDWLFDYLSETEKEDIKKCLIIRTKQVADHVIVNSRIHYSLYDSHAVRSLSSVLTPCCIALLFEDENAKKWLDYTIEYFSAIYTPWGNQDGGWAEGPMYWTTAMAFLTEALTQIESYTKINLYNRPFFQKTGDFILNCCPQDTYRASFCDQSSLGEKSGIKTAFNIRQFGAISNNYEYMWYYENVLARAQMNPGDFFNRGWWDLYFDNMVFKHKYGTPKTEKPTDNLNVKWFRDIDWVAINKNMTNEDEHIFMLTKSSKYGSVSHSHGDQNTFVIFAFGEPLIIKSGHYVGFNSSMHTDFRRQSLSHNTLLIDSKGQYAGMDKTKQLSATGKIIEVKQDEKMVYIKEDATKAYEENVPYIENFTREIYFIDKEYFIIVDNVTLKQSGEVSFLLHSLSEFNIKGNAFSICGEKADLKGEFLYVSSGLKETTQTDEFENVDIEEVKDLSKQHHLKMNTNKAKKHTIVTIMQPQKKNENKYVATIKDDQGHDIFFYVDNNSKTFTLMVDGSSRY